MYVDCSSCSLMKSHIPCLANHFTTELVPILGNCPKCDTELNWGELIQATKLRMKHILQEENGMTMDQNSDEEEDSEDQDAMLEEEEEESILTPASYSIIDTSNDYSILDTNNENDSDNSSSSSFINLT